VRKRGARREGARPLTAEEIELVRAAYVVEFDRSEIGSGEAYLAAFLEPLDPAIEFVPDASDPDAGAVRGINQVRRLIEDALEGWDVLRYELEALLDVGGGRLLVSGRLHARGRGSGGEIRVPFANVWTMRSTRAVTIEAYPEHSKALEAVRGQPPAS
jgi:ketosteroid isomerase-like protein